MPDRISTIAVCGAGAMGAGIAQTAAQHGFNVILYDLSADKLESARKEMEQNLAILVSRQKISPQALQEILGKIRFVSSIEQCTAPVIIEAVVENLLVKTELFKRLAEINGPKAIYASNTSSLSISAIAACHPFPESVVGMHFFNPATIMKLVEVVQAPDNSGQCTGTMMQLAKDLGKIPVLCKDSPGFIVNRVARPFYIEALRLAEQGVPCAQIDSLMESAGFRMGPFKLMDLIGNDINYAVSSSVYEQLGKPARLKPSFLQQEKISEGKLGRKSGAGFYTYTS